MKIRPSSLSNFLRCEYLWHTRHVLGVERQEIADARSRGTFFHSLMEMALRHYAETNHVFAYEGEAGENMARYIAAEQYRERGVPVDEIEARECLAAVRFHIPLLDLPAWEVIRIDGQPCVEIELSVTDWPSEGHTVSHRLDLVMRHRATGRIWHIDFKSSKDNITRPNWTDRDYQLLIARELLRRHGVTVDGSLLLYLRSQPPTPPPVVNVGKKNEGLSLSAAQPCDWPTYEAAVLARGDDPSAEPYAAMRNKLADHVFRKWVPDVTTPAGERALVEQLVRVLDRMNATEQGRSVPTRNLVHTCKPGKRGKGCEYNEWCSAGLSERSGHDLAQLGEVYRLGDSSPLIPVATLRRPDPSAAFVAFARSRGSIDHEPMQEFKP
jgi:hypothetical protein